YQAPGALGLNSLDPFCTKVEVFLQLAQLPFSTRSVALGSAYPRVDDQGTTVIGSGPILEHCRLVYGRDLDVEQTPSQRMVAHSMLRMLEHHLEPVWRYARWVDEAGWRELRAALSGRHWAPKMALMRRKKGRGLRREGWLPFAPDAIYARGVSDLDALADGLEATDAYLLGDGPMTVDVVLHAVLAHCRRLPSGNPLARAVRRRASLERFIGRMDESLGASARKRAAECGCAGSVWSCRRGAVAARTRPRLLRRS
ncbi:MAG: glutathione S-transferase family protein, partial [Myxococcota bacterium]